LSLEQKYTAARQAVFTILQSSNQYNPQVIQIMIEIFKDCPDLVSQGPVLWALMVKGEV
jgi:hypothetical protein